MNENKSDVPILRCSVCKVYVPGTELDTTHCNENVYVFGWRHEESLTRADSDEVQKAIENFINSGRCDK